MFYQHRALDTKYNDQEVESSAAKPVSFQKCQEKAKSKNHHMVDILKSCMTEKTKTAVTLLM